MWNTTLIFGGGGGLFLIVVGGLSLVLQRIVQQDGTTEVELPFGMRMKTNFPALVLSFIGAFLVYAILPHQPEKFFISGDISIEEGDVQDVFVGACPSIQSVSQFNPPPRIDLPMLKDPKDATSYTVLGVARWANGRQQVEYVPVNRKDEELTFNIRFRRKP